MEKGPLADLLLERYSEMPPQLKIAARFVLDHPEEVALSSMREQAAQAGVSHSTMMRLARWLGMDGYEEMRDSYARALRRTPERTGDLDTIRSGNPAINAAGVLADSAAAQVARLGEILNAERIAAAAKVIVEADAIFVLGAGYGTPAGQQFLASLSMLFPERPVRDVSMTGGQAALAQAPKDSVLIAIGGEPYERPLVEQVARAPGQGIKLVAITDSAVSPLARIASATVLFTSVPAARLRSAIPALAAVEILAALIASEAGIDVDLKVKQQDERLRAFGVLWRTANG